jgi:hypothetical protein
MRQSRRAAYTLVLLAVLAAPSFTAAAPATSGQVLRDAKADVPARLSTPKPARGPYKISPSPEGSVDCFYHEYRDHPLCGPEDAAANP